jgi:hypothetical protein
MDSKTVALWLAGATGVVGGAVALLKKIREGVETSKDIYKGVREAKNILPAKEPPKSPQLDASPKHWVVALNAATPDIMVKLDVINYEDHPVKVWLASIPYLYTSGIAVQNIFVAPLASVPKGKVELILSRPLYPSEIEQFQRASNKDEPHANYRFQMLCHYQGHDFEWSPALQFNDVKGSFISAGQNRIVSDAEMAQSLLLLESYCDQHGIEFPRIPQRDDATK